MQDSSDFHFPLARPPDSSSIEALVKEGNEQLLNLTHSTARTSICWTSRSPNITSIGGLMNLRLFGLSSVFAIAASAFLMPGPVLGHHGRALIYDSKTETTVKGTVTEFVWSNPHVQIGIE